MNRKVEKYKRILTLDRIDTKTTNEEEEEYEPI